VSLYLTSWCASLTEIARLSGLVYPPNLRHNKTEISNTYCELSKRRDSIEANIGRSAITALLITELGLSDACCVGRRAPEGPGFKPRIHARCCHQNTETKCLLHQKTILERSRSHLTRKYDLNKSYYFTEKKQIHQKQNITNASIVMFFCSLVLLSVIIWQRNSESNQLLLVTVITRSLNSYISETNIILCTLILQTI